MSRRTVSWLSLASLLAVHSGCAAPLHSGSSDESRARAVLVGAALIGYGIASTVHNPQTEWTTTDGSPADDDDDGAADVPVAVPPHEPASEADRRVEERTPFALAAAYGALAHVELEPCRAQGLAAGYGRVALAFANDGAPAAVGVRLPAGSAPGAQACVEQAFRAVRVAAFDGAPVNVRRPFFVKDGGTGPEHSF
jgi:hypothetical protein